jgi:ferredoxin-NADP reductase
LPERLDSDVVCLVGGIGVTPALAMARALAKSSSSIRLHVDYSVSEEADTICRDELRGIGSTNPRMTIRLRVTRRQGRISVDEIRALAREYPGAAFYLCGSTGYLETVGRFLAEARVPADRIHVEKFAPAGERSDAAA